MDVSTPLTPPPGVYVVRPQPDQEPAGEDDDDGRRRGQAADDQHAGAAGRERGGAIPGLEAADHDEGERHGRDPGAQNRGGDEGPASAAPGFGAGPTPQARGAGATSQGQDNGRGAEPAIGERVAGPGAASAAYDVGLGREAFEGPAGADGDSAGDGTADGGSAGGSSPGGRSAGDGSAGDGSPGNSNAGHSEGGTSGGDSRSGATDGRPWPEAPDGLPEAEGHAPLPRGRTAGRMRAGEDAPRPTDAGRRPTSHGSGSSGGDVVGQPAPDAATPFQDRSSGDDRAGRGGGPGGRQPSAGSAGYRLPQIDAVWPGRSENDAVFVARDGGGSHSIRTGRAGPAARGLARAAMRLDSPALRDILEMTVTDRGVVAAWEEVIMPVLIGIGERVAATERFVEVEHLISRGITEVLGSVARPPSLLVPRVLLAAADEEQHTLPLEALAAALAQEGVPSRLLGARVPPRALGDAVARTGPAAVVLWSQVPGTGSPEQWVRLLTGPHRPLLAGAAGPGWPAGDLPEDVTVLSSLPEAVRLVSIAAQPVDRPH
jgi:hypothetical protein